LEPRNLSGFEQQRIIIYTRHPQNNQNPPDMHHQNL
jgi:hypothetical protein